MLEAVRQHGSMRVLAATELRRNAEAVLEASADHEAEVVVGTEVKGNLQRAVSQSWTRRYNLRLLQPQKSVNSDEIG